MFIYREIADKKADDEDNIVARTNPETGKIKID